jgi:hypothetical protein
MVKLFSDYYGRNPETHESQASIYGMITEGLDIPDLRWSHIVGQFGSAVKVYSNA